MTVPASLAALSTTAASNPPAGTDAVFPELDNHLRFIYSCMALLRDSGGGYLASVSGADTITATLAGLSSYQIGALFCFVPAGTNTGAATLNVNGLGAKAVTYRGAVLPAGFMIGAIPVIVAYDGTNFDMLADPTPVDRFTAQALAGIKTFSVAPKSSVAAAAADELVRKQEMDAAVGGAGFIGQISAGGRLTAPTGWLLIDGKTIGSAASGATARANADTLALYTFLWDFGVSDVPIYTSSGVATTKGANAAADFAANKRLQLFVEGGRFIQMRTPTQTINSGARAGQAHAPKLMKHGHKLMSDISGASGSGNPASLVLTGVGLTGSSRTKDYLISNGDGQLLVEETGTDAENSPYALSMPHYIRYA